MQWRVAVSTAQAPSRLSRPEWPWGMSQCPPGRACWTLLLLEPDVWVLKVSTHGLEKPLVTKEMTQRGPQPFLDLCMTRTAESCLMPSWSSECVLMAEKKSQNVYWVVECSNFLFLKIWALNFYCLIKFLLLYIPNKNVQILFLSVGHDLGWLKLSRTMVTESV